ncbi:MAG: cation transporter, partial [Myxococcota bacterium]
GLQAVVALATGSLTLLGEAVRSGLMTAIEGYSLSLLKGVHSGRLQHFDFGIGKVEQFAFLIFGASLVGAGLWVAAQVFQSLFSFHDAPSPLGLAFAAVVNAVNLLVNGLSLYAMLAASRADDSDIFRAQIRSRALKLANSVLLQILLTIAALSLDEFVALMMDGIGAVFVACVMVVSGIVTSVRSLPDLLDAPLPDPLIDQISNAVSGAPDGSATVQSIRTRRSGRFPHVEVTISRIEGESIDTLDARMLHLRHLILAIDGNIELTIVT